MAVVFGLMTVAAQAAGMMVIHHKVADYAKWRTVFDGDKSTQMSAGLTDPRVFRSVDNANEVTITFDMADATRAKAFSASPVLRATMIKAGVIGKPEILYLDAAP